MGYVYRMKTTNSLRRLPSVVLCASVYHGCSLNLNQAENRSGLDAVAAGSCWEGAGLRTRALSCAAFQTCTGAFLLASYFLNYCS